MKFEYLISDYEPALFQAERSQSLKKGDKQTNKNKQAILQPSSTNKLGQETNKSTTFANLYRPIVRHPTYHYIRWEIACPGAFVKNKQTRDNNDSKKIFNW